ncbi:MAG TPA: hypothetical protein DIT64_18155 [Verrucomicrobiales bacterium]|nr:hypothetical protein [Verrucomicrobiales bacterium]
MLPKNMQMLERGLHIGSRHEHHGLVSEVAVAECLLERPLPVFDFGLKGDQMPLRQAFCQRNRCEVLLGTFWLPRYP